MSALPLASVPSSQSGLRLGALVDSLRRRWLTIATSVALTMTVGVVYLVFATPEYTATGLILIDTKSNATIRSSAPALTDANVESANVESQIEVLKSERVMRRVVATEHLEDDPALAPGAVGRALRQVADALAFWKVPLPPQGDKPKEIAAARALQKLTTAKRLGVTYAVELSATMPDPAQAARVANTYAQAFIDDQMRLRVEMARRMSGLLQSRADELMTQAQQAEVAVEDLKYSGSLEGQNSAAARVKLKNLESAAQTYRVMHDKFLERFAETWQQQFLSLPDAQIASAASPPQSKSAPKTLLVLAAAVLVGVGLGTLRVLVRERYALGLASERSTDQPPHPSSNRNGSLAC